MGNRSPRPKPQANTTQLGGSQILGARDRELEAHEIIVGFVLFAIVIVLAVGVLFGIGDLIVNGKAEYYYQVTCYDDGRKTFDEVLQREGKNENLWTRPGKEWRIEIPIEKCILIQVERPSYIGEFGR